MIWFNTDLVVSWNRGTPSYHPFLDGIFPEINPPAIGVRPWLRKPTCLATGSNAKWQRRPSSPGGLKDAQIVHVWILINLLFNQVVQIVFKQHVVQIYLLFNLLFKKGYFKDVLKFRKQYRSSIKVFDASWNVKWLTEYQTILHQNHERMIHWPRNFACPISNAAWCSYHFRDVQKPKTYCFYGWARQTPKLFQVCRTSPHEEPWGTPIDYRWGCKMISLSCNSQSSFNKPQQNLGLTGSQNPCLNLPYQPRICSTCFISFCQNCPPPFPTWFCLIIELRQSSSQFIR